MENPGAGVEFVLAAIAIYFGAAMVMIAAPTLMAIGWLAPTLLAIIRRRESILPIMAANVVPAMVGHGVVGWMIAMAWAAFGRRRQQGTGATKAWWDILP